MCSLCTTMEQVGVDTDQPKKDEKGIVNQVSDFIGEVLSKTAEAMSEGFDVVYIITDHKGLLRQVVSVRVNNPLENPQEAHDRFINGSKAQSGDFVRVLVTAGDKVMMYRAYTVDSAPVRLVPVNGDQLPEA